MLFDSKDKNNKNAEYEAETQGYNPVGVSVLSQDLHIEGKIKSRGALQIDGEILGELKAKEITIGTTGVFEGKITCDTLTVLGKVSGKTKCKSLTLGSSAEIHGDVKYSQIQVEKGALLTAKLKLT